MNRLLDRLSTRRILIADGAAGTMLQGEGLPAGQAPEVWNLERPDAVRGLHESYIEAGAEIILTNTFGGNPIRLAKARLESKTRDINLAAAQLAREAAGDSVIVFGDLGPTGEMLVPLGTLNYEDAKAGYAEQASALAEGGVDAILIETMSDLEEVKAAVEGVRSVCGLPIVVTMSFDTNGKTMMGVQPAQAARMLQGLDVAVVGANCGRTLSETLEALEEIQAAAPEALLMGKPNAGLPQMNNDELVYDVSPEVMADYALQYAALGVRIFGGCCGSTPDHIRAVAERLSRLNSSQEED
jgi:5-methyltetrahydrofolate--homocysteine methyltransferase